MEVYNLLIENDLTSKKCPADSRGPLKVVLLHVRSNYPHRCQKSYRPTVLFGACVECSRNGQTKHEISTDGLPVITFEKMVSGQTLGELSYEPTADVLVSFLVCAVLSHSEQRGPVKDIDPFL